MNRATGTRFGPQRLAVLAVALAALAGCEEGLNLQGASAQDSPPETSDDSGPVELFPQVASESQRDVEAPDVFEVTEAGLWDGRPSLGGIWVAHPDVGQPERVLIKNTANNKSVTGALFRRDRNLPGPALQVSSSAAAQLGMLAGSPSRLQVVALRREQIEVAPPTEEPAAADPTETEIAAADADVAEEAEAKPAKRKWWQKKPAADTSAAAVAAGAAAGAAAASAASTEDEDAAPTEEAAAAAETEADAPAEKPAKRKWWQKKPAEETGAAVAAAGATAAAAATTTDEAASETAQTAALADPEVTPPAEKPAKRKWWQKKDPNEITETPLDPIEGAAAAIEASEPTAAAAATATAAATTTSALSKPFVQVGTFGVESNAKSAAEKIRRNGMTAQVSELKTEDKTVWRVLVGPANTRAERRAILSDVKDLGFTDAFTARN